MTKLNIIIIIIIIIYYILICFSYFHSIILEPPLCIPGQITLLDLNSTYQPNSSFYIIGYPALCINNSYVPICNSADLSIVEARVTCAYSTEYECGFMHTTLLVYLNGI